MSETTALLGLIIKAEDQASQVFRELADKLDAAFKEMQIDVDQMRKSFEEVAAAAQASSEKTSAGQKEEREEIYLTRQEILEWARTHQDKFTAAGVATKNFADISTADLKRVMQTTTETTIRIKDDLEGVADITDGKVINSQNQWKNTVIYTTDEIKARFEKIIATEKELGDLQALVNSGNIADMKKVVDAYDGYNSIILKATSEQRELEQQTKANEQAQEKWTQTIVYTADEIKARFEKIIATEKDLGNLQALVNSDNIADMKKVVDTYDGFDSVIRKVTASEKEMQAAADATAKAQMTVSNTLVGTYEELKAEFDSIIAKNKELSQLAGVEGEENIGIIKKVIQAYTGLPVEIQRATQAEKDQQAAIEAKETAHNKWVNTFVMTKDEILATFNEMISKNQDLAHLTSLRETDDYNGMRKAIEAHEEYNVILRQLSDQEKEIAAQEKAKESAINAWKNTVVMDTDEVKARFKEIIEQQQEFAHLAGLMGQNNTTGMKKLIEDVDGVTVAYKQASQMEEQFGSMAHIASLQDIGSTMENLGREVTGFFTESIQDGMHFQQQIQATTVTLNSHRGELALNQQQVEALNSKVLELGRSGMFSANEVAEAAYTLSRQGIAYEDIMGGALQSIQDLAVSTDSQMEQTANTVSDIIHEMGDELKNEFGPNLNDQFNGVANMISGAMHNARMTMDDFLATLKYVGPQASAAGMGLQDVSVAIALLGEHGIKASQAGTTLRRMLTNLNPSTKPAIEAFKELGFITENNTNVFYKSNGQLKDFSDIQQILHDKFEGLNEQQQQFYMKAMFGQYALSGMTAVVGATSDDMQELTHQVTSATTAHDLAIEKWDNSAGSLRKLTAEYETLKKEIGEKLLPIADKAMEMAKQFLTWFDSLGEGTQSFLVNTGLIVGALTLVGGKLANVVSSIGFMKIAWDGLETMKVGAGLVQATEGVTALGTAATATTAVAEGAAVASVTTIMGVLGPLLLVGAAIGGIGYAIYKALDVNPMDKFQKELAEAGNQAVNDVIKTTTDIDSKLLQFRANTGALSEDLAKDIKKSSDKMYQDSVAAADARLKKETDDATFLKNNLTGISDQQVKAMLGTAQAQHDGTVKLAEDTHKKVLAEIQKLKDAGVNVTDEMKNQIIEKYEQQRTAAIKALSDTDVQSTVILEKLRHRTGELTAEMASQTISDSAKTRDQAVKAAQDLYDKELAIIVRKRDETHSISDAEAEGMIKAAEKQKADSIAKATEMHTNVVEQVRSMRKEINTEMDTTSGHMYSVWDNITAKAREWGKSLEKLLGAGKNYSNMKVDENGMPTYASGTDFHPGGLALVGEEGPEIVNLPKGAQVIPAGQTREYMEKGVPTGGAKGGMGSTSNKSMTQHITINVNGSGKDGNSIGADIARQLRLQMSMASV